MDLDPEFSAWVLNEENYLRFLREIVIFTGLRRNDGWLLEELGARLRALSSVELEGATVDGFFATFDLPAYVEQSFAAQRIQQHGAEQLTDDDVQTMLDEYGSEGGLPIAVNSEEDGDEIVDPFQTAHLVKASGTEKLALILLLFSMVLRNSELVDASLKKLSLELAIYTLTKLLVTAVADFKANVIEGRAEEIHKKFVELNEPQRASVEYFALVILPVLFSFGIYESIGPDKLRELVKEIVAEQKKKALIFEVIVRFLLLDFTRAERVGTLLDVLKDIAAFMRRNRTNRYLSYIVLEKLMGMYFTGTIGHEVRRFIEDIVAEIIIQLQGIDSRQARSWGGKSQIMQRMASAREKVFGSGEDETSVTS